MKLFFSIILLFLSALAASKPTRNFAKRDGVCPEYRAEKKSLEVCKTAKAFCTGYINRGPSTTTAYSTTRTKTVTPSPVIVRRTGTLTSTTTVYTITVTVIARTISVSSTLTLTSSATASETATITTTATTTPTLQATETDEATFTTTTTILDVTCTSALAKRDLLPRVAAAPKPSCGLQNARPASISGACACFIDTTTTASATTATTTAVRQLTTLSVTTTTTTTVFAKSTLTTTATSTITVSSTLVTTAFTVTPTTTTITAATETADPTTITVATTTTTKTQTATETSAVPTCDPNDNGIDFGDYTFVTECNTNYDGYTREVQDATDLYDCMSQCQTLNDDYWPTYCLAVSFDPSQCNQNCYLKSGVDVSESTPDWQSARVVSPGVGLWSNTCLDGTTKFGDIIQGGKGPYQALCSAFYDDDFSYSCNNLAGGEAACIDSCNNDASCIGTTSFQSDSNGNNCCKKKAFRSTKYSVSDNYQVDGTLELDATPFHGCGDATQDCADGSTVRSGGSDFKLSCNTEYRGLTQTSKTVDATDLNNCVSQCSDLNTRTGYPASCIGATYYKDRCSENCVLASAIDKDGAQTNSNAVGIRMLSPSTFGNTCLDGTTHFGDLYTANANDNFQVLCGMDFYDYNEGCFFASSQHDCYNHCANDANCKDSVYFHRPGAPSTAVTCCLKTAHPLSAYNDNVNHGNFQTDNGVLLRTLPAV